jgi:hypothetical protein
MIYGYIRVSTDWQITEKQRFEILKFCDEKRPQVDAWVEEPIRAIQHLEEHTLGEPGFRGVCSLVLKEVP